jgi:hypothetical protein
MERDEMFAFMNATIWQNIVASLTFRMASPYVAIACIVADIPCRDCNKDDMRTCLKELIGFGNISE